MRGVKYSHLARHISIANIDLYLVDLPTPKNETQTYTWRGSEVNGTLLPLQSRPKAFGQSTFKKYPPPDHKHERFALTDRLRRIRYLPVRVGSPARSSLLRRSVLQKRFRRKESLLVDTCRGVKHIIYCLSFLGAPAPAWASDDHGQNKFKRLLKKAHTREGEAKCLMTYGQAGSTSVCLAHGAVTNCAVR